ncbi:hypothetical protein PPERSA_10031 [Pseudocohnilembus persalinus]|uniref:Uncharacterized protein n=1 Tax=Pseudocohnilembus persalinus TaxID=266149 RepID=A0A0V0QJI7_PSEPJ|nr:hypothetical protein PPERSA_10031 [Pseudocohnilembus persalinus]|eukprot:KRX02414.1 hypothetical protein PPERSA_10031 [Pseudocohnilembus persalinus]
MSDKQQNTNFGYKLCNQGGLHQGECLNYVCVEPVCYKNGLICPVCRYENHLSHKVLPLKQFLQQSLEKIPQVFQHQQKLLEQIQSQEEEKQMLMMGFGDEQQDQQNNQNSEQKQNSESEKSQKNCSQETQNDPLDQLQEEIKKQQKQKQLRAQQLLKDLDSIYEKQNNHLVKLSEQVQYLQSQLVNNYKTVRERIINQSEYYQQKIEDDVLLFCEFIKDQGQVNGESQVQAENAKKNEFVFKKESLNLNLDQYLQKISNLASISTINDQKFEFSLDFEWTYRKYQNMARDINTLLEDIKLKLTNSNKTVDLKVNQILSKSVTRVVHLDTLLQGKGTEEIKFSQKFLSQFVQLENNNKIAKQSKMQNSDQRFALSAEPLSANEPTRFAVKILKLISWISVGIGIEQVLTVNNKI